MESINRYYFAALRPGDSAPFFIIKNGLKYEAVDCQAKRVREFV